MYYAIYLTIISQYKRASLHLICLRKQSKTTLSARYSTCTLHWVDTIVLFVSKTIEKKKTIQKNHEYHMKNRQFCIKIVILAVLRNDRIGKNSI